MSHSPTEPTNADSDSERVELTGAERHRLLSSDLRRLALEHLDPESAPMELRTLAGVVAPRAGDVDGERAVERAAIVLHHCHLPKMADLGVVDYDSDSNRIDAVRRW
jgi:hypothetical protein